MSKRTHIIGRLCIAAVLVLAGQTFAQEDHLIENQRYVVGIDDFSWGNTYVGKYTSGNGLIITNDIGIDETNAITLTVESLHVGSGLNSSNTVYLGVGGTLEVNSEFTVQGAANANGLLIDQDGTLYMKSDFDASMDGFYYNAGANLKVGGEVSNLDHVEGGLNFTLSGADATWLFSTNLLTIGAQSDSNSVSIADGASLEIDYITVGSSSNAGNGLVVSDNGRVFVHEGISNLHSSSYVYITNNGILAVDFNYDASVGVVDIQEGGILEAHRNLIYDTDISNGGGIIMTGTNANWSNLSGTTLSVGPDSEENFLLITDGATVRAGGILIGSATNVNNAIVIVDGGNLILDGSGSEVFDENTLRITEGGKLTLETNYDIDGIITWGNGGIIEAQAEAPVFTGHIVNDEYIEKGALFLQDEQILILNGPAARWSGSAYDLHVGDLSADNALIITNGGKAYVKSVSVGDFKEGGNHNHITITGADSELNSSTYGAIGGTIDNGIWYEGGVSNSITVDDGGFLFIGDTLHNRNTTGTGGLNIRPGGIVDVQDYYQANGAYLNIYTATSGVSVGLLRVADTAEFEAGAALGFDAVATMALGDLYTNVIVESSTLIVGGVTNATTADLAMLERTGASLVNYTLWETNQDIRVTYNRRSITDGGGITPDSMLDQIAREIDRLASSGNTAASNQVEILSRMGSDAERLRQMEQMYSYQLPSYMHNAGVFGGIDQVRARGAAFRGAQDNGSLPRPDGVAGPHKEDQGIQGWLKVYGSFGNRSAEDDNHFPDGYDAQSYGTVLGLDKSFGQWLFGLAGGYAGSKLEGDNGDNSDGTTGYGLLYANYGTTDWFGDLVLSYGLTDMDNTSGTAFDVTSSTEAAQTVFYIGGGYQFEDEPSGSLLRPVLGVQVSHFDQDGYKEQSSNAVAKDVSGFDRLSAQSSLGASVVYPKAGRKTDMELQLRAFWLHEFNTDEEKVGYTLIDSGLPGQFVMRSPDSDTAQLGTGFVVNARNGWQLRADIDVLLSQTFASTTFGGAVLYEF